MLEGRNGPSKFGFCLRRAAQLETESKLQLGGWKCQSRATTVLRRFGVRSADRADRLEEPGQWE